MSAEGPARDARPDRPPSLVVLAPDVLGHSFDDANCARILVAWRDGRVVPALNRELLQVYLKLLQNLGLSAALLRRWGWWFTAADKVRFLDAHTVGQTTGCRLCAEVARAGGAAWVIAMETAPAPGAEGAEGGSVESLVPWTTPQAYLVWCGSSA